jgi:hypothetical protein
MADRTRQPETALFREEQHYASRFLVVALSILALVGVSMAAAGVREVGVSGAGIDAVLGLLLGGAIAVALPLALAFSRLVTEITSAGLRVRLAPWQPHGRGFRWENVVRFAAVTYRPLRDYGGWGIRGTRRHGAYNARGDLGVFLELSDGATFVVGSQEPLELESAVAAACGRESARTGDALARAESKKLVT